MPIFKIIFLKAICERMSVKEKVFVVGFHKTGTTSLTKALRMLDYKVIGPNPHLVPAYEAQDMETLMEFVQHFDAFQDYPWFMLYEALYRQYPNGKFILSERDPDRWLRSIQNHFGHEITPMRKLIYGQVDAIEDPEHYKNIFIEHNESVKAYFKDAGKDTFLVFRIEEGDSWESLCGFLGKPIPRTYFTRKTLPFPHANAATVRMFLEKEALTKTRKNAKRFIKQHLGVGALNKMIQIKDWFLYRFKI